MKYFLLVLMMLIITNKSASAQDSNQFHSIVKTARKIKSSSFVQSTLWKGEHPELIYTLNWEHLQHLQKSYQYVYKQLIAFPVKRLTHQDRITRNILLHDIKNEISQIRYKAVLIPFTTEHGFHTIHYNFLDRLPFHNKSDFEAYLNWLPLYEIYLKGNQNYMEVGMKKKMMAPKIVAEIMISQLEPMTSTDFNVNPFAAPFLSIPPTISSADSTELRNKAQEIITRNIVPSFVALADFMQNQYLPSAPEKIGIKHAKKGKSYYENRIKHYTTLDIKPDSVFNLGMNEVNRIKQEMEKIKNEVNFEGDLNNFFQFLRSDSQFYANSEKELLRYASWLSKKAEGQLPKFFSNLYDLPFTIKATPVGLAPTYASGRYIRGSRYWNSAGVFSINTYNLQARTLYTIPALTLHEGVPGHHLQIRRATKFTGFPSFRKSNYIYAFGEGWALYSEFLGEEMGMYETPYELFGRYTYEIWRACRLVIDVGIHYKDWSKEKAIDFMVENTALSLHEINIEIERYISWPGQAVSYKIGEIVIKSLRSKAEDVLGDKFNIQEFHERILRNGSVPLPVLIEEIDQYIEEKGEQGL